MRSLDSDLLVFGAGSHARKVARALAQKGHHVHAFVSTKPSVKILDDVPVQTWQSLLESGISSSTQILCAIFNPVDSYKELSEIAYSHGFKELVMPCDYYPYLSDQLGWCYWLSPTPPVSLDEIEASKPYRDVLSFLEDEESRVTFQRLHAFRNGLDLAFSSINSNDKHYFNALTLQARVFDHPITYLDVGAYNGDTLRLLVGLGTVERAILFEPDSDNYSALHRTLDELHELHPDMSIEAFPLALGNKDRFLRFSGHGESATLREVEDSVDYRQIHVVRFDDLFPFDIVDFIKIDAEGADLEVLQGMEGLVKRSRPILAVSLYHLPNDITELPLTVNQMLDGLAYKYYIRQHMNNSFESVLYAVPSQ
jgi:FkbM family methyltransferase